MRLSQLARKLNVGISTIVDFLASKGFKVDGKPNTKITDEQIVLLNKEFAGSIEIKQAAEEIEIKKVQNIVLDEKVEKKEEEKIDARADKLDGPKVLGKVDLSPKKPEPEPTPEPEPKVEAKPEVIEEKVEAKIEPEPKEEEAPKPKKEVEVVGAKADRLGGPKVLGKVDLSKPVKKEKKEVEKKEVEKPVVQPKVEVTPPPAPKVEEKAKPVSSEPTIEVIGAKAQKLDGPKVLGKIELPKPGPKKEKTPHPNAIERRKRKRKKVNVQKVDPKVEAKKSFKKFDKKTSGKRTSGTPEKKEVTQKEIQEKLKNTLARMQSQKGSGFTGAKYRKEKRTQVAKSNQDRLDIEEMESQILKVTEFISANELASLMNVSVNDVIAACMTLGMFVSINQRLDAETITVIADEFNYKVNFVGAEEDEDKEELIEDNEEDLVERAPVVTIMGHVDHGKTSLLDYIRKANVTSGEAGGITQHIGAYSVTTESGKPISFLDTPGHEAFTAMRARGAQLTDVVIIVVAADDDVMPQTKEAINHAKAAGVPIIIAINKVDRDNANPEKIKEALANENVLVEDWGGKFQCQHISAKTGEGIDDLLEKILLETELLELKANPDTSASGSVVEAALDKGRGYVTTILVQRGTLKIGDILLAGSQFGRVKAMTDHTGKKLKEAGPSTPVQVLGLDGAPQSGDKFIIKDTEREAREIATSRSQILREQSFRTKKHLTLDEIGRRLAVGDFKELNIILKGDVDGSVEALSDLLQKLSTDEIAVNILSKGVGQISESDVLLATASDAIIIGFQVRPSLQAKRLAEEEEIEIKLYSVIYGAIDDVKDAMEGMLAPTEEEIIVGNAEVRNVFKITKVGTIAGSMVIDGVIKRNNGCRLIREGVVVYSGEIDSLKRFKDDAAEVKRGYECGIGIKNYNDIKEGDVIESFETREVKRKLK